MDAYKLHAYMHKHYPRKSFPIIYNSWLYRFDKFTTEDILAQIPLAADIGAEYFVIDAGWFGKGKNWTVSVGDWSENLVTGFAGRMGEVADAVRAHGMKFGLWIEFERAHAKSDAIRDHEEYYTIAHEDTGVRFFDFANPEARAWMLDTVSGLIDKYGVKYIKNDNNVDMQWDPRHTGYYEYHKGRDAFIDALRAKYPDLYLTSCASGGEQMELANYTRFDSNWPSDNESPYVEMDIYKASLSLVPGVVCFMMDNAAFEVSVGVLGFDTQKVKQVTNQVEYSEMKSSGANFKINLLSVNFGMSFYIYPKKARRHMS
jgi:alpha-galactosidase